MKEYVFHFYVNEYDLEWNDYEYYSSDISSMGSQPFFSERECLIATLIEEGLLTEENNVGIMTTTFLEQMLINNHVYVQFKDGE